MCYILAPFNSACFVDPDSRIECGYTRIAKEHCEQLGCCFVSNVNGITSCYKKVVSNNRCVKIPKQRLECGFPGISKSQCESEASCCFTTKAGGPWCFINSVQADYYCNFTINNCHWTDDRTAVFKWTRHQGRILGQGDFSPPGDHTTGASGWYVFINTTKPRKPNDVARLKSVMIPAVSKMCFQFWYHMYGPNIGTLTVYSKSKSKTNTTMVQLWTRSGTVGPHWRHGTVEVSSESAFQLYVEGTVGNGASGVIALDDFSLDKGTCPASSECTFEDVNLCGWTLKNSGYVNWRRMTGLTVGRGGPHTDHTYGTANGYFLYGMKLRSGGSSSYIISGEYPVTTGRCCSFWYVSGRHHEFTVSIVQNGKDSTIWKTTAVSNNWQPATFTIISAVKYKLKFIAGTSSYGSAIDDIMISDTPCNSPGSCDFEQGLCFYSNSKQDNFDWLIGSGQTNNHEGPDIDHTDGSYFGQYMFIAPSSKEIHETAILDSEAIQVAGAGKCLNFWYYMYGANVGSLHVKVQINGQSTVWQLYGNQTGFNFWIPAQVPLISKGKALRIHFVGIRGLDDQGKLAIDDISVTDFNASTCLTSPFEAVAWGCNFESGLCNWKMQTDLKFDWQLTNGTKVPYGPRTDHTIVRYYTDLGCWKDNPSKRAIPSLEGTDKRLKGNYKRRRDAIELCYQVAFERGFKYFALQDSGWCASSATAGTTYKMYGRSYRCRGRGKGGGSANRVYHINGRGNYLYFNAKWTFSEGTAGIVSPPINTYFGKYSHYCLSFAYFTSGRFRSSPLHVYTISGGKRKAVIWQASTRSTRWRWVAPNVQLNIMNQDQVVFEGVLKRRSRGGVSIDDIDISYGDCVGSGTCSFENPNICGWRAEKKKVSWSRKSSSTLGNNSRPGFDHTYNTIYGHFMYLNASGVSLRTSLSSGYYYSSGVSCVQFFYYMDMDGWSNTITVSIQQYRARPYKGFEAVGAHTGWNMGQATVTSKGRFTVIVTARLYGGKSVVMAFDDFSLLKGECPPIGNCNFENGFCSWSQDTLEDDIDWEIGSGDTPGLNTGPHVDHTTKTVGGYYAFVDSSNSSTGGIQKAIIKSVSFDPTSGRCLSFWYDMFGTSVQTLSVYKKVLSKPRVLLWKLGGNQGDKWLHGQIPIISAVTYQILIEALRGPANGDIAIDDIEFTNERCSLSPPTAKPTLIPVPTKAHSTTFGPTTGNNQVDCNFDKNFCPNWKTQSTRKEFNWKRHQGETDTRDTGPHNDHTTRSGAGYYVYIDASPPADLNDTAWLSNSNVENKKGGCFEFWYHMYGEHVGTLSAYSTVQGSTVWQWFRMGTQGDVWKSAQIYINQGDGPMVTVTIVGTRGDGYDGDIALDDISFSKGNMCQYKECTFEQPVSTNYDELLCGWTNEKKKDDFDWHIDSGGETSSDSGPTADHTLGTGKGHYAYMRSKNHKRGNKAMMISQTYAATPGQCFTFWYYMYGRYMGSLTILQRVNGSDSRLWYKEKQEGDYWRRALVTVRSLVDMFQIVIQGTLSSSYGRGDIAIDDILKVDGTCPLPGDCDFEDFILCEYLQDQNDDFEWIRGHGSTRTNGTGPSTDHTKGDMSGHYYYINSATMKQGRKAVLVSQLFPATDPDQGRCLQFWRHMYGTGIGSLNVWIYSTTRYRHNKVLAWSAMGDQGNSWIQSQAPIFSTQPYRLLFEAVIGSSNHGDIAIDDINFSNYLSPCTYIPSGAGPATPTPTTITPADSNCTFDHRTLCRWSNLESDNFDWKASSASRDSNTGPTYDHTTGSGYFAFFRAYYQHFNDSAVIRSPSIQTSYRSVCFKFAYFMYGRDVYQLNIYKVVGTVRQRIWTRSHNLGDMWRNGQVEIKVAGSIFNIDVEGVRGTGRRGDIAVDDFVVSRGDCPKNEICEFEDGMCEYSYVSSVPHDFQWKRSNGGSPSTGDGPAVDHTTGSKLGNYLYIKTAVPRKENDRAVIGSRYYRRPPYAGVCFNFWYHLMGKDIGTLSFHIKTKVSDIIKWSKSGDQGNQWKHGRFNVTLTGRSRYYGYRLLVEGIVGKNNIGDIAIDDTWMDDDPCPNEGACDFEARSFCSWQNVPSKKTSTLQDDNLDWALHSGSREYRSFPHGDHTRGTALGVYAFFHTGYDSGSYDAQLISETFSSTNGRCLSFWFFLYGREGQLGINVYMQREKNDTLRSHVVPTQNSWYQSEVGLYSRTEFQVIIEGYINKCYKCTVAIDDIDIKEGNCVGTCSSLPAAARVACGPVHVSGTSCVRTYGCCYVNSDPNFPSCFYHPSTCQSIPVALRVQCGRKYIRSYACRRLGCCYDSNGVNFNCYNSPVMPTAFPSTLAPITTPAPSQYDCTFENGFCNFTNLKDDQTDWKLIKGSVDTVPADHTLQNERGHFMYFRSTATGYSANLQTPKISFSSGGDSVCVRFWYELRGKDIFNVYNTTDDEDVRNVALWTRSGNVPQGWNYVQLRVPRTPPFKITFEGIHGLGWHHFITLDDVSFVNGPCPPTLYCDFENSDLCGWSQDAEDDFDWTLGSGSTKGSSTKETRPSTDHTYRTSYGKYLYTGGSGQNAGDKARIESFVNEPTDGSCVEFYYYMKGASIGALNVWIRRGDYVDKTPVWTLSGDQGSMWTRAFVTVVENSQRWKVIFEGVIGGNINSEIAIDDVHFLPGICIPKGECDFEASLCSYENANNNSVNWVIGTARDLQHVKSAPKIDHTTGLPTGHFIYIVGGTFMVKKAHILSEKFKVNPNYKWCLQFSYFMFGDTDEKLNVLIRYSDKDGMHVTYESIFSQSGNHDDRWVLGKANISTGFDFQIVFEGSLPVRIESVLAIDDIKVSQGLCSGEPIPTPTPCALRCKDRTCISSDKVCDFFPDCAQGRDKTDMSDELGCDQCDFETGYCNWKEVSIGTFRWNRTQGHPRDNSSGPGIDHTKGTSAGHYIFTDGLQGTPNAVAILNSPVIKQSHYTCAMTFWYYMRGGRYVGPLKVFILYGDRLTLLSRRSYHWGGDDWQHTTVYIERRVNPFTIKLKVEWRRSAVGDIAVDDIKFINCSLPEPAIPCSPDHFLCRKTRACITKDLLCDSTDDCGDGSDEESCWTGINSYRCDFEDDLCDWQSLDSRFASYRFRRYMGTYNQYWNPFSDHTTGTVSGHYLGSRYHRRHSRWQDFYKARIASGPLQIKCNDVCKIRFYYYYYGRSNKNYTSNSMFSVKIRQCTGEGCNETTAWNTTSSTWHAWIRASVTLQSSQPFQVLFELQVRRWGAALLDDVSFSGCSIYNGTLPTLQPPKKHCQYSEFYCSKDNKCIKKKYRCDYQLDCSDGQDEFGCGSCDFTKDLCGYYGKQTSYAFIREQPSGTYGPSVDHTSQSKQGYFAISKTSGKPPQTPNNIASLIHAMPMPSQSCFLQFSYYYDSSDSAMLSVQYVMSIRGITYRSVILQKKLQPLKQWQSIWLPVQQPKAWNLIITTNHVYVAVDDIKFHNCSFPRANGSCNANQYKCGDGSCVSTDQACNFVPDCRDASDENSYACKSYKERCNFQQGLCNWLQDKTEDSDWSIVNGQSSNNSNAPVIDHTIGTSQGKYLFVNMNGMGAARLLSVVFKASPNSCRMRFFYNGFGKQSLIVAVGYRTLNNSAIPLTVKWQLPDNPGNFWSPAAITFKANRAFQVVIEAAIIYYGVSGYAAIDDISFSPDCQPDPNAKLPTQPPECNPDIEFSCGDGQCIPLFKVCDFVTNCNNKADEETCPSSCDLEKGNTCGWTNLPQNDMDWAVGQGKKPPFDHTKGNKYGHFIYLQVNQDKEPGFPIADFLSPLYNSGAYDCTFSFWYYMYHEEVKDNNDAVLNVMFTANRLYTPMLTVDATSGPKWKNAAVQLPHCPIQFQVIFEGIHNKYTKTNISIDDWKFDCAEKTPSTCDPSTHFQCELTKQCVPLDTLCDMDKNCCDGSDEHLYSCDGYTSYDFESGLQDWKQLKNDNIDFIIGSGKVSPKTGPVNDHSSQEAHGKYIYIDASEAKAKQTAVIVSKTIDATKASECNITFWYNMYGTDMGTLSMSIGVQYGKPVKNMWSLQGNQGNQWKKKRATLSSAKDFQVIFTATVGSGPLSDMALDDISFSSGCTLSDKILPGGPVPPPDNPCKPLFQCQANKKCIPRNQLCDFEKDCPDGEDEGSAVCGYPQGFEKESGFGLWKNSEVADYEFMLYDEKEKLLKTGPKTDARGDTAGSFAYLDVTNKARNTKAILTSPIYENAYSNCMFNFSYYINGDDVGQLRITLLPNDTYKTTVLFDVKGTQGDKWIHTQVAVGRRRHPFRISFVAYPGGGDGGIGIDEINFVNVALPSKCDSHSTGKFRCKNNLCIDTSKVCDFVDDCGDLSDEDPNTVCSGFIACTFQNDKACHYKHNNNTDFVWELNMGETQSSNTGPTHDHTYQTLEGIYIYIEASDRQKGDKAQILTPAMTASTYGACNMMFYYYMNGKSEGELNIYSKNLVSGTQTQEMHIVGDQGLGWHRAVVDLSHLSESGDEFSVVFEGVIGDSFLGDTAVDDVIFSPDCLTKIPRVFQTIKPCTKNEFSCASNGNCRLKKVKCDGNIDCKDGSDENGCNGKSGKRTKTPKTVAFSVVGALLLIAIVASVIFVYIRRKRVADLFRVEYTAENLEVQQNHENEQINSSGGAITLKDEKMITEFIDADLADFNEIHTNTFTHASKEDLTDPKSIVNPFFDEVTAHHEWGD